VTPRVRFAPSPTGWLHVGNARTALFNWLFARRHGGTFILRIEDTDTGRQQGGAEEAIYEDLAWLGLDWNEGPVPFPRVESATGPRAARPTRGPYRQSERGAEYETAYGTLRAKGLVYPCFCSEERIGHAREIALASGRTPGYDGHCAAIAPDAAAARAASGEAHVLRFRVGSYGLVQDILRGTVDFRTRQAFDPVIRRRDGRPTYNLAVVVDDAAMGITHVIRGEDHLTNTALQLRLYEALELAPPLFAHLSLILGPDGSPLSKRHGATSVAEFRKKGYPAEAMVNGLALLGWTPPDERVLMSRDEMVSLFDLDGVNATPAIFDLKKIDWIAGQKMKTMDREMRGRGIAASLRDAGLVDEGRAKAAGVPEWLADLGDLLATSLERFEQTPELAGGVFSFNPQNAVERGALEDPSSPAALGVFATIFEETPVMDTVAAAGAIERAKRETGLKGRALLHPLRLAVTGRDSGPELVRMLPIIERAAGLGLTPSLPGLAGRIRLVLEKRA
jgi:nondiscriminating glutamyl-tRNA synthetase